MALSTAETGNALHGATEQRGDQQQRGACTPPPALTPSYVRYTTSSHWPLAAPLDRVTPVTCPGRPDA